MSVVYASEPTHAVTRVLAVDAHPLVLHGLGAIVAGRDDVELVGAASSAGSGRALIAERPFDVVVIGLDLPGRSGLCLVEAALRCRRRARVVMLACSSDSRLCVQALALGAACVIDRTVSGQGLIEAILGTGRRRLVEGAPAPRCGQILIAPRQGQILALLARGDSNDEIAGALGIAAKTVETQLSRLYRRFEVQGRIELAMLAVRSGWLPPG